MNDAVRSYFDAFGLEDFADFEAEDARLAVKAGQPVDFMHGTGGVYAVRKGQSPVCFAPGNSVLVQDRFGDPVP